jgi:hypothetical protein
LHRKGGCRPALDGSLALAAETAAGEQVLGQIFGSLDQERLADLNGLLDAIAAASR